MLLFVEGKENSVCRITSETQPVPTRIQQVYLIQSAKLHIFLLERDTPISAAYFVLFGIMIAFFRLHLLLPA